MTLNEKAFLDCISKIAEDIRKMSSLHEYGKQGPELFCHGLESRINNLRIVADNFKGFTQKERAK